MFCLLFSPFPSLTYPPPFFHTYKIRRSLLLTPPDLALKVLLVPSLVRVELLRHRLLPFFPDCFSPEEIPPILISVSLWSVSLPDSEKFRTITFPLCFSLTLQVYHGPLVIISHQFSLRKDLSMYSVITPCSPPCVPPPFSFTAAFLVHPSACSTVGAGVVILFCILFLLVSHLAWSLRR